MTFLLIKEETVAAGVRRMVAEQLDKAMPARANQDGEAWNYGKPTGKGRRAARGSKRKESSLGGLAKPPTPG